MRLIDKIEEEYTSLYTKFVMERRGIEPRAFRL